MTCNTLTQSRLKELLHYDPDTGVFTWTNSFRHGWNGKQAGSLHRAGYIRIYINKKAYACHRLAWLYVYGEFPEEEIDHVNHAKGDNRILNLRSVGKRENSMNRRLYSTNNTGVQGVGWSTISNKWRARIMVDSKTIYLGVYSDFFEACCARMSATNKHGFHKNHGR